MKNKLSFLFIFVLIVSAFGLSCNPVMQPPLGTNQSPVLSDDSSQSDNSVSALPVFVDNTTMLKVGNTAPNFALKDMNGKVTILGDLRGKKVVINMFWLLCHGCTDEMPFIQEYYQKWSDPNVVLLAVDVYDPKENIQAFAAAKNLTFTILIDPEKIMNNAYVNSGVPTTYFIDKDGVVREIKDGMFENAQEIVDMVNSY